MTNTYYKYILHNIIQSIKSTGPRSGLLLQTLTEYNSEDSSSCLVWNLRGKFSRQEVLSAELQYKY